MQRRRDGKLVSPQQFDQEPTHFQLCAIAHAVTHLRFFQRAGRFQQPQQLILRILHQATHHPASNNNNHIARIHQLLLNQPPSFTHNTAGTIPHDGTAKFTAGDHAKPPAWQVPCLQHVQQHQAACQLASFFACATKVRAMLQPLPFAERAFHAAQTGVRRLRPLRRRRFKVARPALVRVLAKKPCLRTRRRR